MNNAADSISVLEENQDYLNDLEKNQFPELPAPISASIRNRIKGEIDTSYPTSLDVGDINDIEPLKNSGGKIIKGGMVVLYRTQAELDTQKNGIVLHFADKNAEGALKKIFIPESRAAHLFHLFKDGKKPSFIVKFPKIHEKEELEQFARNRKAVLARREFSEGQALMDQRIVNMQNELEQGDNLFITPNIEGAIDIPIEVEGEDHKKSVIMFPLYLEREMDGDISPEFVEKFSLNQRLGLLRAMSLIAAEESIHGLANIDTKSRNFLYRKDVPANKYEIACSDIDELVFKNTKEHPIAVSMTHAAPELNSLFLKAQLYEKTYLGKEAQTKITELKKEFANNVTDQATVYALGMMLYELLNEPIKDGNVQKFHSLRYGEHLNTFLTAIENVTDKAETIEILNEQITSLKSEQEQFEDDEMKTIYDEQIDEYGRELEIFRKPILESMKAIIEDDKNVSKKIEHIKIPPPIKDVLIKALAYKPEERYDTPLEFAVALQKAQKEANKTEKKFWNNILETSGKKDTVPGDISSILAKTKDGISNEEIHNFDCSKKLKRFLGMAEDDYEAILDAYVNLPREKNVIQKDSEDYKDFMEYLDKYSDFLKRKINEVFPYYDEESDFAKHWNEKITQENLMRKIQKETENLKETEVFGKLQNEELETEYYGLEKEIKNSLKHLGDLLSGNITDKKAYLSLIQKCNKKFLTKMDEATKSIPENNIQGAKVSLMIQKQKERLNDVINIILNLLNEKGEILKHFTSISSIIKDMNYRIIPLMHILKVDTERITIVKEFTDQLEKINQGDASTFKKLPFVIQDTMNNIKKEKEVMEPKKNFF